MALDASHNAWHGNTAAFDYFRAALARASGIPLALMAGYYDPAAMAARVANAAPSNPLRSWFESEVAPVLPIAWDVLAPDPLIVLLAHRDGPGTIAAADCASLAVRIDGLIPMLTHAAGVREKARLFVAGLGLAAARGDDLKLHRRSGR
jgi:hypothetical protein